MSHQCAPIDPVLADGALPLWPDDAELSGSLAQRNTWILKVTGPLLQSSWHLYDSDLSALGPLEGASGYIGSSVLLHVSSKMYNPHLRTSDFLPDILFQPLST